MNSQFYRSPNVLHSALYAVIRWKLWAAAVLSAALLELPFPLAGPLPPWRASLRGLGWSR